LTLIGSQFRAEDLELKNQLIFVSNGAPSGAMPTSIAIGDNVIHRIQSPSAMVSTNDDLASASDDLATSEAKPSVRSSGGSNSSMMLSIVMPAYNEIRTIAQAIRQVLNVPFPCPFELIVVDDGSRDGTAELLATIADPRVVVEWHARNRGKGAALLTGFSLARGTHVVPFDADLEYTPQDLLSLLEPALAGRSDVIYGSRLFGANTVFQSYRYAMGNKLTTLVANVLFDAYVSDLHTCLKLMPNRLLRDLDLQEQGFGLDTEITAHVLKLGYRPFEVPISYHSRTHAQGKKRDGVACIAILLRVRFSAERSGHRRRMKSRSVGTVDLKLTEHAKP
jgi:glycosyltransferase involved in cell wall biosynthesis